MKALAIILATALLASCSGMGMHRSSSGTGTTMSSGMTGSSMYMARGYNPGPVAPLEGPYSGVIGTVY